MNGQVTVELKGRLIQVFPCVAIAIVCVSSNTPNSLLPTPNSHLSTRTVLR
jgi:hypothetical protein